MKSKITLHREDAKNKIEIDGIDLTKNISHVKINGNPGNPPEIEITLVLQSCDVDMTGAVKINGNSVSDKIGKLIFESLKERYGH